MKKKAIEQVPYLTAKKVRGKAKYVARCAFKVVGHEKHLFVEAYENKKDKLNVPVIRVVINKKDYGTFWPETEYWSSCKMQNEYSRLLWESSHAYKRTSETYMAEEDQERVFDFCYKSAKANRYYTWADAIIHKQDEINRDREHKRCQNKQAKLVSRCEDMPELPEDFEKWYKETLFKGNNFVYYKRKGRYATFTCSCCGESYTYATEQKDTYEGMFEKVVHVPRNGQYSRCEKCNAEGHYKTAGNINNMYGLEKCCYVGQAFRGNGFVIRYITVEKIFSFGSPEKYIVTEIARNYFEEGKSVQRDYHLHSGYSGNDFWSYENLGGFRNITQKGASIYPGTYEALKGTILQYSGIEEYMKYYDCVEFAKYMVEYQAHPCIEMIVKMGMYKLADAMVQGYYSVRLNYNALNPWDLLKIAKEKIKLLRKWHGDMDLLKILQMERSGGYAFTEDECEKLMEIYPDNDKIRVTMQHMSMAQFLNRVEKYAGAEFGTDCSKAVAMLKNTATTYLDYLQMRQGLGYDMTRTTYLFPRDLNAAHRKMVEEATKGAEDKRVFEAEMKFPNIKKNYRKLRNRYYYEDDTYIIRPARSAKEIIVEGRTLHHCVGGDSYLRKHNNGDSTILFLRFKDKPDVPYVTIEIDDTRIVQWYGAHDKKPDEKQNQRFLDAYVTRLKCKNVPESIDGVLVAV